MSLRAELQKVFWDEARALRLIQDTADEVSQGYPGGDCWQWGKRCRPSEFAAAKAAEPLIDAAFVDKNMPELGKRCREYKDAWSKIFADYRRASGICT